MTMQPDCLICGQPLKASGGDANMYYCTKRKEYMSELGLNIEVIDSIIYVDPKSGKHSMKVIEIPPYRFTMTDYPRGQRTEVHKTVLPDWAPWDKEIEDKEIFLQKKLILRVPVVLNLPWHDKQKVLERLKLYLLFS